MERDRSKGTAFAFGASFALAGSFVFSKSALNQLSMLEFGLLWFSMGVIWNGTWFMIRSNYRDLRRDFGRKTLVGLVIALLEGVATLLFYLAIQAMENPAVVSFIGNIGPVFVTMMGLTLLRERFRKVQLAGILVTLAGVSIINYREGGFAGFLDPGSVYVISASFLFSVATIVGRKYRSFLNPGYMSLIRALLLSVGMAFLILQRGEGISLDLSPSLWRDLALGSFLETMLVILFAYQALRLIEATRTSLVISTKGVWTLVLAWVFLGVFPTTAQLAGGILSLIGVGMINLDQPLFRRGYNDRP